MKYSEVIIVGAGPAGSSCAYELKKAGVDCIILEKEKFPRTKICAGWITPDVVKKLGGLKDYPHKILNFNKMHVHVFGKKKTIEVKQYSIRRKEFDDYLLKKSKAEVYTHNVISISKKDGFYIIDDKFKCKYLVGAGGTFCPVYRTFFKKMNPRNPKLMITAMEEEFKYNMDNKDCHLWFFDNKLKGYSWFVPKAEGYVNVGIGGQFLDKKDNIKDQWNHFERKLKSQGLIKNHDFKPRGHLYYLRHDPVKTKVGNAYLVGDSLGVSTIDLGEGIGPSIKTGMLCAKAIINKTHYNIEGIDKKSIKGINSIFFRIMKLFI